VTTLAQCPKCDANLPESARTCAECGADVQGATASFTPVTGDTTGVSSGQERSEVPVLVVRKGPQLGERFYLESGTLTVGRDPESGIFLNDMTVSRSHARLTNQDGRVVVEDLGSLNGTYVNGLVVDKAPLSDGDIVQIGTFQMLLIGGEITR
jgi:pSer/pThr/pTyr-binding forkhead associated (FHA) protein